MNARPCFIKHFELERKKVLEAIAFIGGLEAWCDGAEAEWSNGYRDGGKTQRIFASERILECYVGKRDTLSLRSMGLTSLPAEIGQLVKLFTLNISNNQIRALPIEIGQLGKLCTLDISLNQLRALPAEIGELGNLLSLDVHNNQLQVLPIEFCQLANLLFFRASGNQIQALPEGFGRFVDLRILDIGNNGLQVLPAEIGQLKINYLNICSNQLQALPSCLARLPSSSEIHADDNRLSHEAVQAFQFQIAHQREINPDLGPTLIFSIHDHTTLSDQSSLKEIVTFWVTQLQSNFSGENLNCHEFSQEMFDCKNFAENPFYQTLRDLNVEQENYLKDFLIRLKKTDDFTHPSTCQPLIINIAQMLQGICTSQPFKEKCFFLLEDALSTCGDRVANAFNMIYLQRELICGTATLSIEKLASLLIGARRIDIVEGIARELIKERHLGDAIETILFFKVKLKEDLTLPVATKGMLYPAMSGITPEDLEAARVIVLNKTTSKEQVLEILLALEEWRKNKLIPRTTKRNSRALIIMPLQSRNTFSLQSLLRENKQLQLKNWKPLEERK